MDIESNRSQYAIPTPLRPRCCDESEPLVPPVVRPSTDHLEPAEFTAGAQVTNKVQRVESEMSRLDLATAVIAQLMKRLGISSIVIPSFELECGPRAEIKPDQVGKHTHDKHYYVQVRGVK